MAVLAKTVRASTVSEAWIGVVDAVDRMPGHNAFHVAVQITEPTTELAAIRNVADRLLESLRLPPVTEVRNTVFPVELGRKYPEPAALSARYREYVYPRLKKLDIENAKGTYFGRFVDYRTSDGAVDQLAVVVDKLRRSRVGTKRKATYELDMANGLELAVYAHGRDHRKTMAFPCLSFCSFQLDDDRLHLVANYRSQYLVQRAYGNYLGLGELQQYVARAAGFGVGELLVVAGHARVDGNLTATRAAIAEARASLGAT